jgi:hypothetical protein
MIRQNEKQKASPRENPSISKGNQPKPISAVASTRYPNRAATTRHINEVDLNKKLDIEQDFLGAESGSQPCLLET